jgi:hypothetical protein
LSIIVVTTFDSPSMSLPFIAIHDTQSTRLFHSRYIIGTGGRRQNIQINGGGRTWNFSRHAHSFPVLKREWRVGRGRLFMREEGLSEMTEFHDGMRYIGGKRDEGGRFEKV